MMSLLGLGFDTDFMIWFDSNSEAFDSISDSIRYRIELHNYIEG